MRFTLFFLCLFALSWAQDNKSASEEQDEIVQSPEIADASDIADGVIAGAPENEEVPAPENEEEKQDESKKFHNRGFRIGNHRRHGYRHGNSRFAQKCQNLETLLKDLSSEASDDFKKIKHNLQLSRTQRNTILAEWAKENEVEERLEVYLQKEDEMRSAKKTELSEFVASLGDKINDILEVLDNDDKTKEELRQEVQAIAKDAPEGVGRVLSHLFPRSLRHGGHGGQNRPKRNSHHQHHNPHYDPYHRDPHHRDRHHGHY